MKKLFTIILLTLCNSVFGQQIANWSSYYENGFIWNPALTAKWSSTEVSLTHAQEWVGFAGAPQYSSLGLQVPIVKYGKVVRSSIGGFIDYDNAGPLSKLSLNLTYGYHFSPQLFGYNEDYLSIGFGVQAGRYRFDPSDLTAYDGIIGDPNLKDASSASIKPNATIGIFYKSSGSYEMQSHFYFGLTGNQLFPGRIFNERDLRTSPHATAHFGCRKVNQGSTSFIEPNLMVMYAFKKAIHAMASIRYEIDRKFWLAGGGATNGEIFLQTGVIMDESSFLSSLVGDGMIRVGIKGDYMISKLGSESGLGYEGYIAYVIELN